MCNLEYSYWMSRDYTHKLRLNSLTFLTFQKLWFSNLHSVYSGHDFKVFNYSLLYKLLTIKKKRSTANIFGNGYSFLVNAAAIATSVSLLLPISRIHKNHIPYLNFYIYTDIQSFIPLTIHISDHNTISSVPGNICAHG